MPNDLEIGDVDRIALVFLDDTDALETPTALTIDIRHPGYPTTVDTQVTQASCTLGKVFPLSVRTELARQLTQHSITAADLAAGTGCVEYLHSITEEGGFYKYVAKATSPTTSATQASSYVVAAFT